MIVYNITIKVDNTILPEWLRWQREEHIPEIMSTHLFDNCKIFRLLEQDDSESSTFIIQYFTPEIKYYEEYIQRYAPELRRKALEKWNERFIAFRTVLESVQ